MRNAKVNFILRCYVALIQKKWDIKKRYVRAQHNKRFETISNDNKHSLQLKNI